MVLIGALESPYLLLSHPTVALASHIIITLTFTLHNSSLPPSKQDDGALPPALVKALDRVKQGADYMPKAQLYRQLESQLGTEWRDKFAEFDEIPIAAASIGQVRAMVGECTHLLTGFISFWPGGGDINKNAATCEECSFMFGNQTNPSPPHVRHNDNLHNHTTT